MSSLTSKSIFPKANSTRGKSLTHRAKESRISTPVGGTEQHSVFLRSSKTHRNTWLKMHTQLVARGLFTQNSLYPPPPLLAPGLKDAFGTTPEHSDFTQLPTTPSTGVYCRASEERNHIVRSITARCPSRRPRMLSVPDALLRRHLHSQSTKPKYNSVLLSNSSSGATTTRVFEHVKSQDTNHC